ncbi:MAG: hypothetical protein IIW72_00830, partial [Clostridia bacterium]|nr:hypothetical protein [Clostridia bacterium]
ISAVFVISISFILSEASASLSALNNTVNDVEAPKSNPSVNLYLRKRLTAFMVFPDCMRH